MEDRINQAVKLCSGFALWLVLSMATTLPALAQEPTPPVAAPDQAILPFFGLIIGLSIGLILLTMVLIGFVMWMSGSPIPYVSARLQRQPRQQAERGAK